MGQAKRRGTFEQRVEQAIRAKALVTAKPAIITSNTVVNKRPQARQQRHSNIMILAALVAATTPFK